MPLGDPVPEADRPLRIRSSEVSFECPWYRVRSEQTETTDGRPGIYHVVEKAPAVWIVAVTTDQRVLTLHQYRHAVRDWCWEIPAGSCESGQDLETAARRELREETGALAGPLETIASFYTANGICNETSHVFLARDVEPGEPSHDETEFIRVVPRPIEACLALARSGGFSDAPSALALFLCEERLRSIASGG